MLEYLPWSKKVLADCQEKYIAGHFSVLDIELGGMCNLKCVYCDSPDRTKTFTARDNIYNLIKSGRFKWLFICGLGEPTFSDNKDELIRILELCKQYRVKCSMFSNLTNFDEALFKYVEDEVLYVMFKLDSLNADVIKELYGIKATNIQPLFENVQKLLSLVKIKENCTNICASIVPTTKNYDELEALVNFCVENNVFPLVGDLEDSGFGKKAYERLKLSDEELKLVKTKFLEQYSIPICPSVLYGIHILYDGSIAVDESTGLSCHWFWLHEPQIWTLGKCWEYKSYEDIEQDIFEYRKAKMDYIKEIAPQIEELVFGGCGGDIRKLLIHYIQIKDF